MHFLPDENEKDETLLALGESRRNRHTSLKKKFIKNEYSIKMLLYFCFRDMHVNIIQRYLRAKPINFHCTLGSF